MEQDEEGFTEGVLELGLEAWEGRRERVRENRERSLV